ncbi:hypothetical protein [Mesorhizobium sp. 113-3-3]|uniref:hypothetical protein n=1 Tax=Mesorhizobium sp. 113-3-3 TaxID=2744516 RepID=UPI0018EBCE13|nr:hypothetical protein [Mesorhizobium sp. 113-3-3]
MKQYGEPKSNKSPELRFRPAVCTSATKTRIEGNPDPVHVSSSHIERANLHAHGEPPLLALTNPLEEVRQPRPHGRDLHRWYHFIKMHKTQLKMTPAIAVGRLLSPNFVCL